MASTTVTPEDEESSVTYCQVAIVGAGVAGASAAYHLAAAGVSDLIVLDKGDAPGQGWTERTSGTAVMTTAAPTIKMMVQLFAASSSTFVKHHGRVGAMRYLSATREGLEMQKHVAKVVAQLKSDQLCELGSFYVGYEADRPELLEEYKQLQSLGCDDIEWYDKDRLSKVPGCSPVFDCAIFFPKDAIIDSSSYAKGLLKAVTEQGNGRLCMNTAVTRIYQVHSNDDDDDTEYPTRVQLASGGIIHCRHVVVATGGLHPHPRLYGVLKPCYSYLVHVPMDDCAGHDNAVPDFCSSNFFTWGFTHDWCWTAGKVRTSGEDHFSALKDSHTAERCANLIQWTQNIYQCPATNDNNDHIPQQDGIYSETPDCVPLIGTVNDGDSALCYLVGCNAWGQSVLSYCSSLVPGLLGYQELSDSQRSKLELFSIRRFPYLPSPE